MRALLCATYVNPLKADSVIADWIELAKVEPQLPRKLTGRTLPIREPLYLELAILTLRFLKRSTLKQIAARLDTTVSIVTMRSSSGMLEICRPEYVRRHVAEERSMDSDEEFAYILQYLRDRVNNWNHPKKNEEALVDICVKVGDNISTQTIHQE